MAEPMVRIGGVASEDIEMEGDNNEVEEALGVLEGAETVEGEDEETTAEDDLVKPTFVE